MTQGLSKIPTLWRIFLRLNEVSILDLVKLFHHSAHITTYPQRNDWRIRINGNEHGVPHVHVQLCDGSRVSIKTREVLAGGVSPAKRLNDALRDIENNAEAYMQEYRRLNP